MEHWRPDGLYQGYYCGTCGKAGLSMYSYHGGRTLHGHIDGGACIPNPSLVAELDKLNTVEAELKRQFKATLKHGK